MSLRTTVFLATLAAGCAPGETHPAGYIYIKGKWQPIDAFDREKGVASVPYCVLNPEAVSPDFLTEVLGHVERTYNRLGIPLEIYRPSPVRAERYGSRLDPCSRQEQSALMVRILFKKEMDWSQGPVKVPGVSHIGPRLNPIHTESTATMYFNVDKSGTWPVDPAQRGRARLRMYHVALHEFAHALGLAHEHQRQDAPGCAAAPQRDRDTTEIEEFFGHQRHGAYDPYSITNYCHEAQTPSAGDREALMTLYGEFARPEQQG